MRTTAASVSLCGATRTVQSPGAASAFTASAGAASAGSGGDALPRTHTGPASTITHRSPPTPLTWDNPARLRAEPPRWFSGLSLGREAPARACAAAAGTAGGKAGALGTRRFAEPTLSQNRGPRGGTPSRWRLSGCASRGPWGAAHDAGHDSPWRRLGLPNSQIEAAPAPGVPAVGRWAPTGRMWRIIVGDVHRHGCLVGAREPGHDATTQLRDGAPSPLR